MGDYYFAFMLKLKNVFGRFKEYFYYSTMGGFVIWLYDRKKTIPQYNRVLWVANIAIYGAIILAILRLYVCFVDHY